MNQWNFFNFNCFNLWQPQYSWMPSFSYFNSFPFTYNYNNPFSTRFSSVFSYSPRYSYNSSWSNMGLYLGTQPSCWGSYYVPSANYSWGSNNALHNPTYSANNSNNLYTGPYKHSNSTVKEEKSNNSFLKVTEKRKDTEEPKASDKLVAPKTEFSKSAVCNGTFKGSKVTFQGITHYKYSDCPSSRLVSVGNGHQLRDDAAAAFKNMQAAAKKDGINLFAVSGFRSTERQKAVFTKKFTNKSNPSDSALYSRLRESAPSGYSEHHTGLAIDINSTSSNFANTKEYRWLKANASKFGFELSFPQNNSQGLMFEPWHYRFVGKNNENASTFAAAKHSA